MKCLFVGGVLDGHIREIEKQDIVEVLVRKELLHSRLVTYTHLYELVEDAKPYYGYLQENCWLG